MMGDGAIIVLAGAGMITLFFALIWDTWRMTRIIYKILTRLHPNLW